MKHRTELFKYQKRLKENFFDKIPISEFCYGYKKGVSYKDYLNIHTGAKRFLRLDITDFFGSITEDILKEVLNPYVKKIDIDGNSLLNLIINAVTLNGKLPQGAVTSPVLSNIVFRQLDIRLYRYCMKYEITYTRYVDDLLFSSNKSIIHQSFFETQIGKILQSCGFRLNKEKTIKSNLLISLNGFVIGPELRLSRKKRYIISAIVYCYNRYKPQTYSQLLNQLQTNIGLNQIKKVEYLHNYLSGYRSFLIGFLPKDSIRLLPEIENLSDFDKNNLRLIKDIEEILEKLNPS